MVVPKDRKTILFITLFIWIILAFSNTLYNAVKSYTEVKEWAYLSDTEKRQKIFGDLYDFFIFVRDETDSRATIAIYSKDVRTFFLGRYYLYPRKIIIVDSKQKLEKISKEKKNRYIAVFNNNDISSNGYEKVAAFSSKRTTTDGYLYKLK
jgi:hypothetical protein